MEEFGAAALLALPFAAYLLVLAVIRPPSAAEWAWVDPILRPLPRSLVIWGVPVTGGLIALGWTLAARPTRNALRRALLQAALGVLVASVLVCIVRVAVGNTLPAFIPAEESAGPGLLLSMSAGYLEELVCRLGVLAISWHVLSSRLPRVPAVLLSALASGLAFAFVHRLGEAEPSNVHFVTRLLIPGFAFSVAALAARPPFLVSAHLAAHLLLPVLFAAPG